ncbi:MAG: hypothetical protein ACOY3Y_01065 [Acidobacteriota bacterium]
MDLNYGISATPGVNGAELPGGGIFRRELAKSLLTALLAASSRNDDATLREVTVTDLQGHPSTWTRTGTAECSQCLRTRLVYIAAGPADEQGQFCPECWTFDLYEPDGGHVAHASEWFERLLHRLPPGSTIKSITIAGKTIELNPSLPADSATES